MRIISGQCRGRKLVQIQGQKIRPTSDRVREAVFNIIGPGIRGMRVLDLFAGTGALGLEALSRGAASAVFVDTSCAVIRKNVALCRMAEQSTIISHDLSGGPLPPSLFERPFGLIFMDPPYRQGLADTVLAAAGFGELIAPKGMVIVEQDHKETLNPGGSGLDIYRQKKYSKTFISLLRAAPATKG